MARGAVPRRAVRPPLTAPPADHETIVAQHAGERSMAAKQAADRRLARPRMAGERHQAAAGVDAARVQHQAAVVGEVVLQQQLVERERKREAVVSEVLARRQVERATAAATVDEEAARRRALAHGAAKHVEDLRADFVRAPGSARFEDRCCVWHRHRRQHHLEVDVGAALCAERFVAAWQAQRRRLGVVAEPDGPAADAQPQAVGAPPQDG